MDYVKVVFVVSSLDIIKKGVGFGVYLEALGDSRD